MEFYMDLYMNLSDQSEMVYKYDLTGETAKSTINEAMQQVLNFSSESWDGDGQRAFLEDFYKWVEESNEFIEDNTTLADYIAAKTKEANDLLKEGQNLHFDGIFRGIGEGLWPGL